MPEEPLFDPAPEFAAGWYIEDPVAQGALKAASVIVLDELVGAATEAGAQAPDLGDYGPLGIFPAGVRAALTPLTVEKVRCAAAIVGWKLAQPGEPMPPGCIGEELALELMRQEAVVLLDLAEANKSIGALGGVFEICQDDDVRDLWEMEEPADAALALGSAINQQMGKADMRVEHWFDPFYRGDKGVAGHPLYAEREHPDRNALDPRGPLEVIGPATETAAGDAPPPTYFRVIVRCWADDFVEREAYEQMPDSWIYYREAQTADQARAMVWGLFPETADTRSVFDDSEAVRLDRPDLARISIDVQRVGRSQEFVSGTRFYAVGSITDVPETQLGELAAITEARFPVAVVARDRTNAYLAVSLEADSFEEADANLDDALGPFVAELGVEDFRNLFTSSTTGQGRRSKRALIKEIRDYRRQAWRPPMGEG